jgi:hypothetical protein
VLSCFLPNHELDSAVSSSAQKKSNRQGVRRSANSSVDCNCRQVKDRSIVIVGWSQQAREQVQDQAYRRAHSKQQTQRGLLALTYDLQAIILYLTSTTRVFSPSIHDRSCLQGTEEPRAARDIQRNKSQHNSPRNESAVKERDNAFNIR